MVVEVKPNDMLLEVWDSDGNCLLETGFNNLDLRLGDKVLESVHDGWVGLNETSEAKATRLMAEHTDLLKKYDMLLKKYDMLQEKYDALEKLIGRIPDVRIDINEIPNMDDEEDFFEYLSNEVQHVMVYEHGEPVKNLKNLKVKYKYGADVNISIGKYF